jgi:hypothetical protein
VEGVVEATALAQTAQGLNAALCGEALVNDKPHSL